jgi:glycosyltransferase involved in cell wall biosynthesis
MNRSAKPVILVLISSYLPGERAGGPVRTTSNMVEWLGDDFDFRILTSDRDLGDTIAYPEITYQSWQKVGKAHVRYLAPSDQSLWDLRQLLQLIPYDILYINGVFPALSLKVLLLHRLGLLPRRPVIVAPRGQWRPEALGLKPLKKRLFMTAARLIGLYHRLTWHASNEGEQQDIEREVGSAQARGIQVISNLPLLVSANSSTGNRSKAPGVGKLIFLSRMVDKKNFEYFLHQIMSLHGSIQLDVYGSLEDPVYWQKCKNLIMQLPDNIQVTYCGVVPFDRVLHVLSQYHLFVLPTLSENFGQVIIESLVAGCPVLISDRTPWQDLDAAGAGWVIPLENPVGWQAAIQQMVDMDQVTFAAMVEKAFAYSENYRYSHQLVKITKEWFEVIQNHHRSLANPEKK